MNFLPWISIAIAVLQTVKDNWQFSRKSNEK